MTSCVKHIKTPRAQAQALSYLAIALGAKVTPGPKTKALIDRKRAPTEWQGYVSQAAREWKATGGRGSPPIGELNRRARELATRNGYVVVSDLPKDQRAAIAKDRRTPPSSAAESTANILKKKTARQAIARVRAPATPTRDYIGQPKKPMSAADKAAFKARMAEGKARAGPRAARPQRTTAAPRARARKTPRRAASFRAAEPQAFYESMAGPPRPTEEQAAAAREYAGLSSNRRGAKRGHSSIESTGRYEKMPKRSPGSQLGTRELEDILGTGFFDRDDM